MRWSLPGSGSERCSEPEAGGKEATIALTAVYANLSCSDLARGIDWFTVLFGRGPDAQPMAGLAEWHHGAASGFQLYENAEHAGHGTLTLILDAVRD